MLRILQLLLLIILVACQAEGESSGDLISGHRVVDDTFSVSIPTAGTRNAGDLLTFTLTFPYAVTVLGGVPRLTLNVGGTTRYANYVSGTGTDTLIFTHTVLIADNDSNGISVSSTLDLNGSTLTYTGTNGVGSCSTSLSVPSTSTVKVDNIAPIVSSVSAPSNATYYLNNNMTFTATMSEATIVTGTPRLVFDVGGVTTYANYLSGSGTTSLVFRYTVLSGDVDANGIAITATLDANGGTLKTSPAMMPP